MAEVCQNARTFKISAMTAVRQALIPGTNNQKVFPGIRQCYHSNANYVADGHVACTANFVVLPCFEYCKTPFKYCKTPASIAKPYHMLVFGWIGIFDAENQLVTASYVSFRRPGLLSDIFVASVPALGCRHICLFSFTLLLLRPSLLLCS